MSLQSLIRVSLVAAGAALLASCATTHQSNDNPREWSFSPMVEARKFYASGLSVEEYVKGKPKDGIKGLYVFYLCNGFIEAGDEIRLAQCKREFDRNAAAVTYKELRDEFTKFRTMLDIYANQFLLEQGRFKEVEQNLLPYMTREGALVTFDRSKMANAHYKMVAANILARAQRNTGGITDVVRGVLKENASVSAIGAVLDPRSTAIVQAEHEYLLGNYAACYDKVARGSVRGVGLHALLGAPLDVMYEGTVSAMNRMMELMYARIQALCAYEAQRWDDARAAYEELLKQPDVASLRGTRRLAHTHLAQIAARRNDVPEAVKQFKAAIEALESERAALDSEAGRLGYVTNKSEIYAHLVDLLVQQGNDAEAFEYVERGKARALVDMLASKRSGVGTTSEGGAFSRALRAVDEAETALPMLSTMPGKATRRSIDVRREAVRGDVQLGSLLSASALSTADVQKHLRPGETLLEYFGEGERLFAFVVTQKGVKALRLDARQVAQHARAFRKVLTDSASRDYQAAGRRLHDAALAPALPHVGTGQLTIVPHGDLHYVPFAALHDGRNYLIQKTELRLLPSASVLPFLGTGAAVGNGLLILGNPDLGDAKHDLPGAEQEARVLERMNKGARVLLRKQASETALRKLGPQYREIHFAMHGKFDSANAMSSGLYMAKDSDNDGVLSVGELYDLQLNVDLVVLSACETALGDTSKGNDVVGLNRGFLFAGARSIVSSLWEVDDNATRDLMVAFYQQRARHGKAGGLRQAQLSTLAKYPHPYYWAAFQMSGLF